MTAQPARQQVTSRWEWVAGGISALVVVGMLAVLGSELVQPDRPPDVRLQVDSVLPVSNGYLLQFRARNAGTEAAAALVIRAELVAGEATVESSSVTLDYLAGGSVRAGGAFFRTDPARYQVRLRPVGYQVP